MNILNIFRILLLLVIVLNAPIALCRPGVSIDNVMVTEPPPGVEMSAGYFEIRNAGNHPVSLVKVTSPDFGSIELHRSVVTGGIARMIQQESVTVPPDSSLQFKPGDYHLMMLRPRKKLSAGNTVSLTFYFSDSTTLSTRAVVMKMGMGQVSDEHLHH